MCWLLCPLQTDFLIITTQFIYWFFAVIGLYGLPASATYRFKNTVPNTLQAGNNLKMFNAYSLSSALASLPALSIVLTLIVIKRMQLAGG